MKAEYQSLMENETWCLVNRPNDKIVLPNRWVFKIKQNQDGTVDRYKARLVAGGHRQTTGIDYEEVFAPVARLETIRSLLAASVENEMYVHQMDVIAAYIQGDLSEEIYMEQPKLFSRNENKVCLLNKPLYGLKQAGRQWYKRIDDCLQNMNFKRTETDPCVYVNSNGKSKMIIIIYVDDLILASTTLQELNTTKKILSSKFKMKDLGPINNLLGIKIEREKD